MKIAFVYDAVYPWVKGGAEKRIYELGKRLVIHGIEVHVFGVKWWEGAEIIVHEGMFLHGVCKPMELYTDGRRSISEALIFSIKLLPHLFKERFDVIDVSVFPYFSCFSVKFVSSIRRVPMVITWHEVWSDYWYEYIGWWGLFGKLIEYMVSKLTCMPISVSFLTKKNLEQLGVNSRDIHIVPNGIDLKVIDKITPSVDQCDVLFAGRLIKEKNVDILLEAIDHARNALPGIKCHIIGSGPEKERLAGIAAERNLMNNIQFFEFMMYEEVIARIKSSKVVVLPSGREGFGMVVLDAFACGIPVVTVRSDRNAASELVNAETGFVVNRDALELGSAIRTLVTDNFLRDRMAVSAKKVAQKYDWAEIVNQLECLYGMAQYLT